MIRVPVMSSSALLPCLLFLCATLWASPAADEPWRALTTADGSTVGARHETSAVELDGKIYVIGGRHTRSMRVFDAASRTWSDLPDTPLELHHFQPVVIGKTIYSVGAMTCCYPDEPSVADINAYDTQSREWQVVGTVPADRVRGGAGSVFYQGWIYLVGGNTLGHSGGAVPWLDRYHPTDNTWEVLSDAPNARDHFQAAVVDGRIVATGGRQTTFPNPSANVIQQTDVYDIATGEWSAQERIPTARGGTVAVAYDGEVIVLGGEITTQADALQSAEAYDVDAGTWRILQPMITKRHGAAAAIVGNTLHVMAGSRERGGAPQTDLHETLDLGNVTDPDRDDDGLSNDDEIALHGTDPDDPDSDDDGLLDGEEIALGTSPNNADSDADGLGDASEGSEHGTDPLNPDSDDDMLLDGAEVATHGTDPLDADSDDDTLGDGAELNTHGTDPLDADTDDDTLGDGAELNTHGTDPLASDSDADTLSDAMEIDTSGTDPLRADTDDDGLDDGREVNVTNTDPLEPDTDNDGLTDGQEVDTYGSDPTLADTDNDGVDDGAEVAAGTNPTRANDDSGDSGDSGAGGSTGSGTGGGTGAGTDTGSGAGDSSSSSSSGGDTASAAGSSTAGTSTSGAGEGADDSTAGSTSGNEADSGSSVSRAKRSGGGQISLSTFLMIGIGLLFRRWRRSRDRRACSP